MRLFLMKNVRYPEMELESGVQGTVYVGFTVDTTGTLQDIAVLRGVPNGPGLSKEAERAVRAMPRWEPGVQGGKKVRVRMNLPVKFRLK